jgi:hypothetical protein
MMEKQIEEQFKNAFFDILNEDGPESYDYLRKLLNEIIEKLCKFVPGRRDIHDKIRADLEGQIGWDIQAKLIHWIDTTTRKWLEDGNKPVGDFLKMYHEHLELTYKETQDAREALTRGENITGEMPKNMKTGVDKK